MKKRSRKGELILLSCSLNEVEKAAAEVDRKGQELEVVMKKRRRLV